MGKNEPLRLTYQYTCTTEDIGGHERSKSESGDFELAEGPLRRFIGFCDVRILRFSKSEVVFEHDGQQQALYPGCTLKFYATIEADDDHEGVSWSTDYYRLTLTF